MTFKAEWEKAHTQVDLSEELILKMLGTYYTGDNDVKRISIIEGGCANINVIVSLYASETPIILRVYLHNKNSMYKEQRLSSLLHGKLPVPTFHHVSEEFGYTFAITDCLPGRTLRDCLLNNEKTDIRQIMFNVGKALGAISSITFSESGFFDNNLAIEKRATRDDLMLFCFECLDDNKVKQLLPQKKIEIISTILKTHKSILPSDTESNLVHADFDPANILVTANNKQLQLSGILDWEFSFSGSTLCDVANMLRYAHHLPADYQDSFLQGLQSTGYQLSRTWQITVDLLNIVSLLDCLTRADSKNTPKQVRDIQELLDHLLTKF